MDEPRGDLARSPVARALGFEVRGHHRHAGLAPDRDRFVHRFNQADERRRVRLHLPHRIGALAALVTDVEAAVRLDHARERHHFARFRESAGVVLQAAGQAEGAVRHAFFHQLLHRADVGVGRGLVVALVAHHPRAHRGMTDQQRRVRADALLFVERLLIANRPARRSAVLVDHRQRDALRHHVRAVPQLHRWPGRRRRASACR